MENIALIVLLLFGVAFLAVLSNRFKFPFPIAPGTFWAIDKPGSGLPLISLQPYVVFIISCHPCYMAQHGISAGMNLKLIGELFHWPRWDWCLLTTTMVAIVAHYVIPDVSWPLCFLIGAIVSPSDAVAATTVTKGLGLDPRLIAILEGESLVNDASGLIAYKYALAAIMAGNFIFWQAGLNFIW